MEIHKLVEFKNWADNIYLDYISDLSEEEYNKIILNDKSIRSILIHIYDVYWSWFRTMTTQNYDNPPDFDNLSKNELIREIREINNEMLNFSKSEDLQKGIPIRWSKEDNEVISNPSNILFNAVNHSSYHRGQIAIFLRHLGLEEISETDYNPYIYEIGQNK